MNRPHSITAHIEIPKEGAEGVLLSHGGNSGGYSLFIKDKKLHYAYNYVDAQRFLISSTENIPAGAVEVRFEFLPTGKPDVPNGKGAPGWVQLYINGEVAGQGNLPVTIPLNIGLTEGLTCGRDAASSVSSEYATPFQFTGTIHDVVIDVSGDLIVDQDAKMRGVMAHQ